MSTNLNLKPITFQDALRSSPIESNFQDIETGVNDLQSQIDAINTPASGSEVSNARDYHSALRDRLRSASTIQGNAVITGLEVSENGTPDMTVLISAGEAIVNGVAVVNTAQAQTGTITAPSAKRWDVVAIGSDNTISVLPGNDSNDRVLPTVSSSYRPLALIELDSSSTSITDSMITDISAQGCIVDGRWYFKIQDAIDSLNDRTNANGSGEITINAGSYYEEVDLSGLSNITLRGKNQAILYRVDNDSYCLKSDNSAGTAQTGIIISGLTFHDNGKGSTGATVNDLVYFDDTDFKMDKCHFVDAPDDAIVINDTGSNDYGIIRGCSEEGTGGDIINNVVITNNVKDQLNSWNIDTKNRITIAGSTSSVASDSNWIMLKMGTVSVDPYSTIIDAGSDNYYFQPSVNGYYLLSLEVEINNSSDELYYFALAKNCSITATPLINDIGTILTEYKKYRDTTLYINEERNVISTIAYLLTTDTVRCAYYTIYTAGDHGTIPYNNFCAHLLSV